MYVLARELCCSKKHFHKRNCTALVLLYATFEIRIFLPIEHCVKSQLLVFGSIKSLTYRVEMTLSIFMSTTAAAVVHFAIVSCTHARNSCPVTIPSQFATGDSNPLLSAFNSVDKQAMFDRYSCLRALYPEVTYYNLSKINPWLSSAGDGSLQVKLSNGWCGTGNTQTAVCDLFVSQFCSNEGLRNQRLNGNCAGQGIPLPLCPSVGLNVSIGDFFGSWRNMDSIPIFSSPDANVTNVKNPRAAARFVITTVVPLDGDVQTLEEYFPTFVTVRSAIQQFKNSLASSIPEASLSSQFGSFIQNVSPAEGEYILRSAYETCIGTDLATSFNNCMLQNSHTCLTALINIARRVRYGTATVPMVNTTAKCQFGVNLIIYQYICDEQFTEAPDVRISEVEDTDNDVPVKGVSIDISHKCFCNNTSLKECSAARQYADKQVAHRSLLDTLEYVFVAMPPICVVGILLLEFHHKQLFWRWRKNNHQVSWQGVKSLLSEIVSSISPLQLLTSQLSHAHIVQITSVWLLLFNIILFVMTGRQSDNQWLFAVEVMAFYMPLTLCASSSARIRGGIVGLTYTAFLTYFLITFEDFESTDRSQLQARLRVLNGGFSILPLSILLIYFMWQIVHEARVHRRAERDAFETAFSIVPLRNQWYLTYVRQVFTSGYQHSQRAYVPGSARVVLSIAVSSIALVYITIIIGIFLDLTIDDVLRVAGESCYLGYAAVDAGTRWKYLASGADAASTGMLSCHTAQEVAKILRSIVIILWILCIVVAMAQLRYLYKHYQKDLAAIIQGKRECFPKQMLPNAVTALLGSMNFVGFHIVAMMLGMTILFVVVFIAVVLLAVVFVLPYVDIGFPVIIPAKIFTNWVYNPDNNQLGWISVLVIVKIIQRFIVGYTVLEDKKRSMQLRNRRAFEYVDFLLLAVGVLNGLVKFAARAVQSMAINLAHMLRADAAVVPRGFDHFDVGFKCYTGMLAVDRFYSNPILLLAVDFFRLVVHRNLSRQFLGDSERDNAGMFVFSWCISPFHGFC